MTDGALLRSHLQDADVLAAAFALRALVAAGEKEEASRYLLLTLLHLAAPGDPASPEAKPKNGADTGWHIAALLWVLGEDFEAWDDETRKLGVATARQMLPTLLAGRYDKTVAYGAFYGALRALAPHLPELEPARSLKDLREFILTNATSGGRLAAGPHTDRIDASLLLLVPFGVFGAEDLQMVATVQAIEAEGVSGDAATAWLAWYYQIKGTHPRRLAELRASLGGDSLWATAFRVLFAHMDGDEIVIRHVPTGHDHPYQYYTPERIPRDPVAGRPVELRATVSGNISVVRLEWLRDGEAQPDETANYSPPSTQEEGFWSVHLGPFRPGAHVRYRWVAVASAAGGGRHVPADRERVSPWFEFGVLVENGIERAVALSRGTGEQFIIRCADRLGIRAAVVTVTLTGADTLQVNLSLDDPPAAGSLDSGEWRVGDYRVALQAEPFRLTILDGAGRPLLEDYRAGAWTWWEDPAGQVTAVERCVTLQKGERLFGTGERFDRLDRRGTTVVNSVYNQYKEQGDRTYLPVPLILSSQGHGLWVATDRVGELDLGAGLSDRMRLTFRGSVLDMHLIPGPGLPEVLDRFTRLTGRPALPPRWAFGPWMSSNNWDSQAEVERQVRLTEEHDIPASVLVVEQWSDEATFYLFNDARYTPRARGRAFAYSDFTFPEWGRWPAPRRMVDALHRKGIRVLFWQIPVWKAMGDIRHEQHDLDEAYLIEQGYVVKNSDGTPYRIPEGWFAGSLLIDFTNPEATRWWLARRRYLLDEVGLDGFKTDGGEFVWDRDAVFANDTSGESGRNLYANQYIGATYRFVQERTAGQGVTFSRAGYTGAQQFPLHWAGDAPSTWPALRASVVAVLNAGLAGVPFWGFDVGGFSGDIPSAELFCRSAAVACFCPVMQYHAESKAQYNQDRTPWNISERTGRPEVIDTYRHFAHLRLNLLPYIYSQAIESQRTGIPLMRPLFLMHPEDPGGITVQDEYYFGADVLVAPVLEPRTAGREVYLPPGDWFDFWTGRFQRGSVSIWCEAPWDRIPVFVRAGAVIPLSLGEVGRIGEGMRNQDATQLRHLHLKVYAGTGPLLAKWWPDETRAVTVQGMWEGLQLHLSAAGLDRDVDVHVNSVLGKGVEQRVHLEPGQLSTVTLNYSKI